METQPPPALDHLVFGGPDLAEAVAAVTELTGVAAVPGGRHLGEGTANYLISLGPGYLEIIGPDPLAGEHSSARWFGLDDLHRPRLLTWAIRPAGLDAAAAAARAHGYDPGPVRSMSRRAADGSLLRWRLTRDTGSTRDGVVPFLIDWGDGPHPCSRELPALDLRGLAASHPRPDRVRAELSALGTHLEVTPGEAGLRALLAGPRGSVKLS